MYKFLKSKYKDNLEKANKQKHRLVYKFCENLNFNYVKNICSDKNNKILLYAINEKLTDNFKNEIIGVIVYRIILYNSTKIRIYIKLISTHHKMRAFGYGSLILNDFIKKYSNTTRTLEIVLLSLRSSHDFYCKNGFIECDVKYIQKKEDTENLIQMIKVIDVLN
jgi:predicted GNAT family N-acyltransferase